MHIVGIAAKELFCGLTAGIALTGVAATGINAINVRIRVRKRSEKMITVDLPLILTASFFFIISWAYGWGLLKFFRHRFAWDMASVVGIVSVVCCTFTFVWMVRLWLGYNEPLYVVYSQVLVDLAIVFYAALPGMTWVRVVLRKDEQARREEIASQRKEIVDLQETIVLLCEREQQNDAMLRSIEAIIKQEGEKSLKRILLVLETQQRGIPNLDWSREGFRN